ncbi:tRNA 2-thiouridine(34) synthase MnmA [Intestinibacillus sp. Marseille-P6563]|uniref:tRNA 2-thiouridine(34) synthase MnmA n=1 Tax=Intestinibacillus sp. Marseille-P6563 TaxID=2364792 RepID=UPI000F0525D2|nr:tRNA 2-thiouridine(34) synthase MnmA [Intestinibacillus sp. Marseille-P6563]
MKKVVLGLSGGVDSAVAASLLREQGYEVHGLFLELGLGGEAEAQKVADAVGIPLYIAHRAQELEEHVCRYFAEEYQHARTPNPCVMCNPTVKFRALADYADSIGAQYLATGHYARIGWDAEGRALLQRARSPKDQTYMLHRLPRAILERCLFPLGEAADKDAVRALAQEREIPNAQKKDSMDVCFIPDGDWCGWLERRGVQLPEGNFVDPDGNILGRHKGIHQYTVGQRKGLGVAASGRLFVHELRPETNEVVLSLEDVFRKEIIVRQVNYCAPEYAQDGPFACEVRVRYSKHADRATVYPDGTDARIVFDDAVRAPAAGQAAVFYDGDTVIGGGFID